MSLWRGPTLVVGHRGGRGPDWPPENTIEAFARAYAEGARAIELDVRASADGVAVVFHDRDLARLTLSRDPRRVDDLAVPALRAIDLGGGVRIPRLLDALAWARERGVAVNVELKYDVPSRAAVARAAVAAVASVPGDVLFSSFDPLLLAMAAALAPRVPRALLTHAGQARWADVLQETARPPITAALHVERAQVDAAAVRRYARRGLRVGVWTVNDAADARALADMGVASIITDRPGAILDVIGRR